MNNEFRDDSEVERTLSRRDLLKRSTLATAGVVGLIGLDGNPVAASERFAFRGVHQSGITTRVQSHLAFATFDVAATNRSGVAQLLRDWSNAAARLIEGRALRGNDKVNAPAPDTGEALDLGAVGLTLTFGFGPSLFDTRFGLQRRRPDALIDLPHFVGDRLTPQRTGGDLCVQACADDPIVAFHAIRNLSRLGAGRVTLRSLQMGSGPTSTSTNSSSTPRNLLGFKDGTNNLAADSASQMNEHVWVSANSTPEWMRGGTYLVARRIRIHLEQWSSLPLEFQEGVIGRFRGSGAPLTGHREHDPLLLDATVFGQPVIPALAHVRAASPLFNRGVKILRRGYNFADGVDERTGELDAGLMFICFQKDVRRQFVTLQNNLATNDSLSQYTVHTGSGVFACPGGARVGGWVGEELFA